MMIWLILVAFCFSHIQAMSKCSCCKAATRGFKPSKVLDMDFLMDFHYPKAMELSEETGDKTYPLSKHIDHWVISFEGHPNPRTVNPVVSDHRDGIVKSNWKIELPHAKEQFPIGQHHAEEQFPIGQHHTREQSQIELPHAKEQSPIELPHAKEQPLIGQHHTKEQSPIGQHQTKEQSPIGQHHTEEQSPIQKFIRNHAEEMKRDFLNMIKSRKTRQTTYAKQASLRSDSLRSHPHFLGSSGRKRHARAKRFFVSRKIHHFPKARRFKLDPFGKFSWTPWHTNGHLVNVTKRETSNRRMKLSDILIRAGFKKDKEEAIKVVLPLLLSDLKETPTRNAILAPSVDQVISSSSSKQSQRMRNFKIKGDDGKEFSFSASASDVQQLMDILAKPNSSVMLERVSLDKNRSQFKTQTDRTKPPGRKKTQSNHSAKDGVNPVTVNDTDVLRLKEFETSVFESIVQLDIPRKQSKSPTSSTDLTKDGEATTTASDTSGS